MTNLDYYSKGLELAQAGRQQEAFEAIQQHLNIAPDDYEALNDAGAILHCLGRSADAVGHLLKARTLKGDSAEIVWNLAEALLADGRAAQTVELFDDMQRMDILNPDIINRTANVFLRQNNKADAVEMLLRSNQQILNNMIEAIQTKRPKIAFFCGLRNDTKFLEEIYEFARYRYLVQMPEVQDIEQVYEVMKTSDISWFEWCTDVVVEASKLPKVCKNIVRLHRFEAYTEWPSQVNWENIDTLILVGNSFVKQALCEQVPNIHSRTNVVTIPNGVNLDKFRFVDRQRGKNLACIGHLNLRKNPMFLLQCMQKLHYIDPQYKLFFAGTSQDPMLVQYLTHMVEAMKLTDTVFFDSWQEDINSWLSDKHFIVSSSVGESQGMGIAEAMACGLKPVVHNFPGANEIFPSEFLFDIAEQFCEQICSGPYEPQRYRSFIEERYPLKEQLGRINDIFTGFEIEIDSQNDQNAFRDNLQIANTQLI